jgi:hypothetical protein
MQQQEALHKLQVLEYLVVEVLEITLHIQLVVQDLSAVAEVLELLTAEQVVLVMVALAELEHQAVVAVAQVIFQQVLLVQQIQVVMVAQVVVAGAVLLLVVLLEAVALALFIFITKEC